MTHQSNHSKIEAKHNAELDALTPRMKVAWETSKTEAFDALMAKVKVSDKTATRQLRSTYPLWKLAVAAVFIISIGVLAFFRFDTKTIETTMGEQLTEILPDGSEIQLNAASKITYHPYWWRFNRQVILRGEAFFDVQKGERFEVMSSYGTTEVLGTSFNIYARESVYEVRCYTGKVKVKAERTGENTILVPGNQTRLSADGQLITTETPSLEKTQVAWINKHFYFTAASLTRVVYEVSIRYNIPIKLKAKSFAYTGNFEQYDSVEKVLNLICKPNGYTFIKHPDGSYTIIKDTAN